MSLEIQFTGHHLDVTPALRSFTEEKFNKLQRHFEKFNHIQVTFAVEKLRQIAEANISLAGGELHASAEAEDMYSAIDGLIDKLDRQLLKHKGKMQNHRE